jgi:uncharacterized membrane protein
MSSNHPRRDTLLTRVARRAPATAALVISSLVLTVLAPTVGAANGLEVTTPYPAVAVAPGNKVSFDLSVSSTRSADVALSWTGVPNGWTAGLIGGGFVVDGLAVSPDKAGTVRLDVTVPADATNTTANIRVNARGGGAEDTLPVTVRVNAEAAGAITLTTNTPELTGASDKSFKFDLQLKNDTAQDVTASASASGPTGWDITTTLTGATDAASTVVKAGATQSISVTAKAAEGTAADTYPIKVTATAGDRTIDTDLSIAITGSYGMDLATPNQVLSTHGSAGSPTVQTFEITNNGTAPITAVKLEGTPPSGWTVTIDPADGLQSIDPQQVGRINATITPSGDAVAGDYVITFKTTSAENTTGDSVDIRFTVDTSPIWAFVGIALIALILGGLFYVFRTYGRR